MIHKNTLQHRVGLIALSGALGLLTIMVSGCGIGATTVPRNRFDYASAISDSSRTQMLQNLVRIRYAETPVFLDVSSIISQYSLAGTVQGAASLNGPAWLYNEQYSAQVLWYERPTISYVPLTGEKFVKAMMSPIPPASILQLVQSGWPVDFVLRLTCDAMNGLSNRRSGQLVERTADPQFDEVLAAMRRIQVASLIGVRIDRKDKLTASLVLLGTEQAAETVADRALVRRLLHLAPDAKELQLVYGAVAQNDKELALLSRSPLELLSELAACVEVPEEHAKQGWVYVSPGGPNGNGMIRIHSGRSQPANTFAAIRYQGYWFWIDQSDFASKRMISMLMFFMSMIDTGGPSGAPIITIPAG